MRHTNWLGKQWLKKHVCKHLIATYFYLKRFDIMQIISFPMKSSIITMRIQNFSIRLSGCQSKDPQYFLAASKDFISKSGPEIESSGLK